MRYDFLTDTIIGCAFEVMNTIGTGFLEKVYENALVFELSRQRVKTEQQKKCPVYYKGNLIGTFFPDILVEDTVIVELKVVKKLEPIHSAQVINYLKAMGYKVGLLINFGVPKIEIKRLSNTI